MFSKIRNITTTILHRQKYSFSQKPSLKQKMRTQNYEKQAAKSKQYSHVQIGLYGLVFACCFAAIPLYRTFCQHVGLVGNNDKKTYDFKDKKIVNLKKYIVKFRGFPQPDINWQFQPIQKQVVVSASQTAIVFYRLRNKQKRPIVGFSTYNLAPQQSNLYFSKIQCFCFNQQMVNPQQQLLLPLFFYLQPQINQDPDVGRIREISVNYQFYQSKNQDLAKFAQQQIRKVEQNKRKLLQMRAKKHHMSVEDYQQYIYKKELEQEDSVPVIDMQAVKAEAQFNHLARAQK